MRGGHNRLPTAVKEARGTLQPCRENREEPRLGATQVPAPPKRLSAAERAIWLDLAHEVDALGVFTEADLSDFELMVEDVAYARKLKRDTHASPNQKIAARRQAHAALAAFGLSPQARGRVQKAPEAEQEDEFSEFDA